MIERWTGRWVALLALASLALSASTLPAQADPRGALEALRLELPTGRRGDAAAAARFRAGLASWLARRPRSRPALGTARGDEALRGLPLRPAASARFDRVVLLSIDGLRPDALGPSTPHLARLASDGVFAAVAETITRSTTLPSHASMLTGVGTDLHGITWNGLRPERGKVRFPTALRVARAAGVHTASFVGKAKLEHLVQEGDVDAFEVGGSRCRYVNRRARPYLLTMRTGLAFVHYPDPDGAGHRRGWMTDHYAEAVAQADACVGELLGYLEAAAPMDRTLVIVTADHGGHDRTHGSADPVDVRIPWIAWGPGVAPVSLGHPVHTVDTAPTVLGALGLPAPRGAEGHAVTLPVRDPRWAAGRTGAR